MERLRSGFELSARYSLSRRIAAGGMGEVWEAVDDLLDRPVAIKIMHPHTAAEQVFAQRFHDEAQYSASLRSPHIVGVFDYGEDDGLAYLVMELVPGNTVAQLIRAGGALRPDFVTSVLAQVADGLAVAHDGGIIHRDVKPGNILVTPEGEAKLGDFGIARAIEGLSHTRTGELLGTPQYLSPEQARGETASPLSDLYSLGVVGHEMLTGKKPFERSTPVATALAHLQDPPPPLPDSVPPELAAVVMACLEKEPADRPASAREVARSLGEEPVARPSPSRPDEPGAAGTLLAAAAPAALGTALPAVRAPAPFPDRTQALLATLATVVVLLLCVAAILL